MVSRLWGPHRFIARGHRGLFPRGKSYGGAKLTTDLNLVSTLNVWSSPLRPHAVMLKQSQGTPHFTRFIAGGDGIRETSSGDVHLIELTQSTLSDEACAP
jgi:hypothetical protein